MLDIDPLTKLLNRRGIEHSFECEVKLMQRISSSQTMDFPYFSMLLIDIDNFKGVNDTFGHHIGDEVLRSLALIMRTTFRGADLIHRVGGDEFIIILPNVDTEHAFKLAEKLRIHITQYEPSVSFDRSKEKTKFHISISIGVSPIILKKDTPHDEIKMAYDAAYVIADKAMYDAKRKKSKTITKS
ncbi:MAG: GGDEF domain-containing protein [Candidatus Moranbacteria bacterium]|nr:GGDEF domain-containing protein [Candidatus Moranbacteria bacterium]